MSFHFSRLDAIPDEPRSSCRHRVPMGSLASSTNTKTSEASTTWTALHTARTILRQSALHTTRIWTLKQNHIVIVAERCSVLLILGRSVEEFAQLACVRALKTGEIRTACVQNGITRVLWAT